MKAQGLTSFADLETLYEQRLLTMVRENSHRPPPALSLCVCALPPSALSLCMRALPPSA